MKRTAVSILTVLLAFSMSTPGLAQVEGGRPQTAAAGPKVVEKIDISPKDQRAALEFWTRERVAAAQPLQLMVDASASAVDLAVQSQALPADPTEVTPAGAPAADADAVAQAAFPDEWAAV